MKKFKKFIPQIEPIIDENELNAMQKYLKSNAWLTEYKKTEEFEKLICKFTGSKYSVVVNNGTVALTLALLAFGIKPGDEIITPDLTMIATPNSAKLIGAEPIFVDIEKETLCMDIKKAENDLSSKTKALIYVSFDGRTGDPYKVKKFCKDNNLIFIEDAAQSLGSLHKRKQIGTFSDIGIFSFSPHKIITTGQGGALVTDNSITYKKLKKLKDFGRSSGGNDIHDTIGFNFKFTDLQATIGIEQMKKLPHGIRRKKKIFKLYYDNLKEITEIEFIKTNLDSITPWSVDVYVKSRVKLACILRQHNIGTRLLYPPVNTQKVYNIKGSFPVTEKYSKRGLWLPSSLKLTDEEINQICSVIKNYYDK